MPGVTTPGAWQPGTRHAMADSMPDSQDHNLPPASKRTLTRHFGKFGQTVVCEAFAQGLVILVPDHNRAKLRRLFQDRVTSEAIDHWRAGRRHPPQWARDIVKSRLRELARIADRIEPDPCLRFSGLMRWNARRRAQKERAGNLPAPTQNATSER